MPCNIRNLGGRGVAIYCSRGGRTKPCVTCGKPSTLLCDYPVTRDGKPGTCDRAMCPAHRKRVGPDTDYCLAHAEHARKPKEEPNA